MARDSAASRSVSAAGFASFYPTTEASFAASAAAVAATSSSQPGPH